MNSAEATGALPGGSLPGHVISLVAEHARVSQRIVAMVLAGRASVAPGTRNRVITAIAEVGCTHHPAASDRGPVGLLVDTDSDYDHSPVIRAITAAARDAGLSTMVVQSGDADRLLGRLPIGLIQVTPQHLVPAAPAGTRPSPPAATVTLDHRAGGRLATRHLLDHGHHRVWHVGGPRSCPVAREREAGWRDALAEADIEAPPVVPADWSAAAGYAAGQVLARRPEVRAIFAASDQMALGVLRAMSEAGRGAPGDVSIVGFDDIAESEFFNPPLSTIRLDLAAAGRAAVEVLLGLRAPVPVVIPPVLVQRRTVAGPMTRRASRAPTDPRPREAALSPHR